MSNEVVSVWNEERLGQLTKLWGQGLSITQIGLKLGVTRNAVVGKVHRMGLPKRQSPIVRSGKPFEPKRRKLSPLTFADWDRHKCCWPSSKWWTAVVTNLWPQKEEEGWKKGKSSRRGADKQQRKFSSLTLLTPNAPGVGGVEEVDEALGEEVRALVEAHARRHRQALILEARGWHERMLEHHLHELVTGHAGAVAQRPRADGGVPCA